MKAWGIIAAAGSGARLGAEMPKAFVTLAPGSGMPMFIDACRSLLSLEGDVAVEGVTVVVPDGWAEKARDAAKILWRPVEVVEGGATRQESVRRGLATVPGDVDVVVVHDAARPYASLRLFEEVLRAVKDAEGAVAALALIDTIKHAPASLIDRTVPREDLWRAQTPQAFRRDVLTAAHQSALADGFFGTDDAELVERYGGRVVVVPGEESNIKITSALDIRMAHWNAWAISASAGVGYDAHALVSGRPLIIGGVSIPFEKGLDGHSDADVLSHAIADAVLGAAHAGDLGRHFPSHDERWSGVSGVEILRHVAGILAGRDLVVRTVDATVALEKPALESFKEAMRKNISEALGCLHVNIKATTTDGLGVVGQGQGAAASAVVVAGRGGVPQGGLNSMGVPNP